LLQVPSSSGAGFGNLQSLERIFRPEAILDFEAERLEARAMLSAFGSLAMQRASDNADHEARNRNPEGVAYWQRVTALIAVLAPTSIESQPDAPVNPIQDRT
jgi:hypothetical protein